MTETLRIGLLGCGAIAQSAHLPALARARRVRLCAICDGAEDLLHAIGRRTGVSELYTNYKEFLSRASMDALILAVPDPFHVPLAIEALKAGKHVLVEKPLGTNSTECLKLVHLVRQTGLKLQVGCMKRHDPGVAFARQFVREKVGNILSVNGVFRDSLFRSAMQDSALDPLLKSERALKPIVDQKADKERYNLWTQGAHLFDCLRFLGGDVVAVTAQVARSGGQCSWHGLLEFVNGARGHFELTCKVCGDWQEEYSVLGDTGSVKINIGLWVHHRPAYVRAFDGSTQQWSQPLGGHSNAFANQLDAFAATVLEDKPANPDVLDGLATVGVLEALENSIRNGSRIAIPVIA